MPHIKKQPQGLIAANQHMIRVYFDHFLKQTRDLISKAQAGRVVEVVNEDDSATFTVFFPTVDDDPDEVISQ